MPVIRRYRTGATYRVATFDFVNFRGAQALMAVTFLLPVIRAADEKILRARQGTP